MNKADFLLSLIVIKYSECLQAKKIPDDMLVEIKDYLTNLRTALDYLWHKIPDSPDGCFPIANSEAEFLNKIGNIGLKYVTIFRNFQDYNSDSWIRHFNLFRNKNCHVFNKPVSKEEFIRIRDSVLSSNTMLEKRFIEFRKVLQEKAIHKYTVGDHNSNVSGDFIYNAKNVHASFFVEGGENDKYVVRCVKGQKDTMDTFGVNGGELGYDSNNVDFSSRVLFSLNGENNSNTEYLIDSFSTENCFGCISLNHKKYCILNKQYSEDEYKDLREKIIAQMKELVYVDRAGRKYTYGEFFPTELSPVAYNESIAQEYVPITKQQAEDLKYPWLEDADKGYVPTKKWDELPDTILEVDNSILKDIILCEAWDNDKEKAKEHKCSMAFKITPDELATYRKFNLPLPRKCPNTRSFEKFQLRNPVDIWHRQCMCDKQHPHHTGKCTNEFETSYAPDRPEIVYCEQCYQQEVA